jgi:hypothetical protein
MLACLLMQSKGIEADTREEHQLESRIGILS